MILLTWEDKQNVLIPSLMASRSSVIVESVITTLSQSTYVSSRDSVVTEKMSDRRSVISSHDDVSSTRILRVMPLLVTLMDVMVILKGEGEKLFRLISGLYTVEILLCHVIFFLFKLFR